MWLLFLAMGVAAVILLTGVIALMAVTVNWLQ
jgi:hypothetical protein